MGAIALVLDRAWIDGAQVELSAAADAAALAAGRKLASDDLLRVNTDDESRLEAASDAAVEIAAQNLVSGVPVQIDPTTDVVFGKIAYSRSTGRSQFLETEHQPLAVVVAARASRSRGNPVGLLMDGLTGKVSANVTTTAEAAIDNHLVGFQSRANNPIPCLPIAILAADPRGSRTDTWQTQIVARRGRDVVGYDEAENKVTGNPDGIPEIVLQGVDLNDPKASPNFCFVSTGGAIDSQRLSRQIAKGWLPEDVGRPEGLLPLPAQPMTVTANSELTTALTAALEPQIGECRICLLYLPISNPAGEAIAGQARCTGVAAGRVMQIVREKDKPPRIVFQPGVLVTHTAITATDPDAGELDPAEECRDTTNNYIYKLRLTR